MSSLFSQIRKPVAFWPMRHSEHDPSNVRTLDVSGGGNHLIFGDGSDVGTFVTKAPREPGYCKDGTSEYLDSLSPGITSTPSALSVCLFFKQDASIAANSAILLVQVNPSADVLFILTNRIGGADLIGFRTGLAPNYATIDWRNKTYGNRGFLVGVYDGAESNIWLNHHKGTPNTTPDAPIYAADQTVNVLSLGAAAQDYYGCAAYCGLWDVALTETEVHELTRRVWADFRANRS